MRNKGKKRMLFLLVVASVIGFSGCSYQKESKATAQASSVVNLMEQSEIGSMDTLSTQDTASINAQVNVFDGLYQIDDTNKVAPAIAKDFPNISDDGLTYTITLREDVTWSNGEPVTAKDFIYAWQRLATPANQANYMFLLDGTFKNGTEIINGEKDPSELGAKATDEYTIEIRLEQPVPYLTSILAFTPFFPQNEAFVTEKGDAYGTSSENILTNGPFLMKNWNQASSTWDLEKNEDYYNRDAIKLENIHYEVIKEAVTGYNLFNEGQLDMADIYGEYVKQNAANEELQTVLTSYIHYFKMNQKRDGKDTIFANENVRKAVYYAIDKEALVKDVLSDGSEAINGFIPNNFVFNPETGKDFREDAPLEGPDKATALAYWQKATADIGDKISIEMLTKDTDADKKVAEFIQDQLQTVLPGLTVEIKSVPLNNSIELTRKSDYELAIGTWGPDYQDPMTYLYNLVSPNNTNYENKDYDQLIADSNTTYANDLATRWDTMIKAEKLLVEETAGIVPIYQRARSIMVNPSLKGVYYPTFGPSTIIKYAYMEE